LRKIQIELNIRKKHFYIIAAVIVVLASGLFAFALTGNGLQWHPLQYLADSTGTTSVDADNNSIIDHTDNLTCKTAGCVDFTEVNFNYAVSSSKGGPATNLSCPGCVNTAKIDSSTVQRRISGSCADGRSITAINIDGTINCSCHPLEGDACGGSACVNQGTFACDGTTCVGETNKAVGTDCTGFCKSCSGGSCANTADGYDYQSECPAIACTNYLIGWSGNSCTRYSGDDTDNGDCNGAGACNVLSDACIGSTVTATCGSASCRKACPAGGAVSSYDSVSEVCYVSGESCGSGQVCDSAGTCKSTNPCASAADGTDCSASSDPEDEAYCYGNVCRQCFYNTGTSDNYWYCFWGDFYMYSNCYSFTSHTLFLNGNNVYQAYYACPASANGYRIGKLRSGLTEYGSTCGTLYHYYYNVCPMS
jgi:hypothetical protein